MLEKEWEIFRPKLQENITASQAFHHENCRNCQNVNAAVRCMDCRSYLCVTCDLNVHNVTVPCFLPLECEQCEFTSLQCVAGSRNVAVATAEGLKALHKMLKF
ncbi:hypothetical protein OUZ56_032786 [Daphnia magna]|uniref:CxC3 like cysteine cluster domain-containing protein n=1 Tax=Daphnia magna TaxID=35525 RepID=A0ABQ9ZX44_9CRUS|nr:hypothetical protein OUZ56_032786 [Daphnia magna]